MVQVGHRRKLLFLQAFNQYGILNARAQGVACISLGVGDCDLLVIIWERRF